MSESNRRRLPGAGYSAGTVGSVGNCGSTCETNMWTGSSSSETPSGSGASSYGQPRTLWPPERQMRAVDLSPMEKSQILVIGTMMGSKGLPYRRHTYQGPGVALDDLLQGTHYPCPHWLTIYSGPLLLMLPHLQGP